MKNQKFLTAFLGGLVGILLSGYAYYITHRHYAWLFPVGVFLGSAGGYCVFNLKRFFQDFLYQFDIRKASLEVTLNKGYFKLVNVTVPILKFFQGISWDFQIPLQKIGRFSFKVRHVLANLHPVTQATLIRTVTTFTFFVGVGYVWITKVIPSETLNYLLHGTGGKDDFGSLLVLFSLMGLLSSVVLSVMNIYNVYDEQQCFWIEYEKYNNKFTMTLKNWCSDAIMFIVGQLVVMILLGIFLVGLGYVATFGLVTMMGAMILLGSIEYAKAMKDYKVLVGFCTTLVITGICYFVFGEFFDNQMVIWTVALGSGCACGAACHSLDSYLARFESSEIITDKGFVVLDKMADALLLYVPRKLLKVTGPYIRRFFDNVWIQEKRLARL